MDEKQLFDVTTSQPRVVCHFYHPDFRRCAIMNKHLREIAPHHFTTKFVYLNAEKAPFLLERLKVHALPTVLCFVKGVVKDRIVGFEELGNSDDFPTKLLEVMPVCVYMCACVCLHVSMCVCMYVCVCVHSLLPHTHTLSCLLSPLPSCLLHGAPVSLLFAATVVTKRGDYPQRLEFCQAKAAGCAWHSEGPAAAWVRL